MSVRNTVPRFFSIRPEQKQTAEKVLARVEKSGAWKGHLATKITPATNFYPAEEEHQDYLERRPNGYTCHFERKIQF